MGIMKKHEHESGFFEENVLAAEAKRFPAYDKKRQYHHNNHYQTNGKPSLLRDPCKRFNMDTYQNKTIVIDSDDENDKDSSDELEVSSSRSHSKHAVPESDDALINIDDDDDDEEDYDPQSCANGNMTDSSEGNSNKSNNHVEDISDDDDDIVVQSTPRIEHRHANPAHANSDKSKAAASSNPQLQTEIEHASTIRAQGKSFLLLSLFCFQCIQSYVSQ